MWLASPGPSIEPEARAAVAGIFDDFPLITAADRPVVTAYLERIEEPLRRLQSIGFQLFGVQTRGTYRTPEGDVPDWRRSHFVIAPDPCYFRVEHGGEEGGEGIVIHRLASSCDVGMRHLVRALCSEVGLTAWPAFDAVQIDYELNVPWCPLCCLDEAAGIP